MTTAEIENRIGILEREIAQLKSERSTTKLHPIHTLEGIHGSFENDKAFKEAARLGRNWRSGQRRGVSKTKAKRK